LQIEIAPHDAYQAHGRTNDLRRRNAADAAAALRFLLTPSQAIIFIFRRIISRLLSSASADAAAIASV